MDMRIVFLGMLSELEERLQPGKTPYEVLRISTLLRQLVLEQRHAVDLLNRGRNEKLTFRVNIKQPLEPLEEITVWNIVDGLYPETASRIGEIRALKLSQFLACKVIYAGGHWHSVGEIIAQLAYVEGGVHMGDPKGEKQELLTYFSRNLFIAGGDMNLSDLRPIARVVLQGVDPLRRRLERELASPKPGPDILDPPKSRPNTARRRRRK